MLSINDNEKTVRFVYYLTCLAHPSKLATLLKNKDQTKVESLKTDFLNELAKLNKYLENDTESAIILFSFLLSTSTGTFPSVFNPPNSTGLFAMSTGSILNFIYDTSI
jgi:hypothetical protein